MTSSFVEDQAKAWREIPLLTQNEETVNGPGCTVEQTTELRRKLPSLLKHWGIRTILDIGCGDWTWMQHVDLGMIDLYTGWDVDPKQIERNQERFPRAGVHFENQNVLTAGRLPQVDLIIARQMLIHLPNAYITTMLEKFKQSGSTYLLASHWPDAENSDKQPEGFRYRGYMERRVNFEAEPFNLGKPIDSILEPPAARGIVGEPHQLALFRLPKPTFQSRVHAAPANAPTFDPEKLTEVSAGDTDQDDSEGFSVLGVLTEWQERINKASGEPPSTLRSVAAVDTAHLQRVRSNLYEVARMVEDDTSLAAAWLLLGTQTVAIDAILKQLIGGDNQ